MPYDRLRENDIIVTALQQSLRAGREELVNIPGLLKRVIREERWVDRTVSVTQQRARFSAFAAFMAAYPPEGLHTDYPTLRRLCRDDAAALDALDQVTQRPASLHANDNVQGAEAPTGNAAQAALRRLRKDRPDLHARVLGGDLSPHRAAVLAGFRPDTLTVPREPAALARALRRKLSAADLTAVCEALAREAAS